MWHFHDVKDTKKFRASTVATPHDAIAARVLSTLLKAVRSEVRISCSSIRSHPSFSPNKLRFLQP